MREHRVRLVQPVAVQSPKHWLDYASLVSAALIPLVVLITGNWLSEGDRKAQQSSREASRVSVILQHLSSDNPRERELATLYARYLAERQELPKELMEVFEEISAKEDSASVAKGAATVLQTVEENNSALASKVEQKNRMLAPRLYFHINSESQRAAASILAGRVEDLMSKDRLSVPGVQKVRGPSRSQLRFFKRDELAEAEKIVDALDELKVNVQLVDLSGRYEDSTAIRPRHFELWLGDEFDHE